MPAAVKDLEAWLDRTESAAAEPHGPYTVAVCGERASFENEADKRLVFTPDWNSADSSSRPRT